MWNTDELTCACFRCNFQAPPRQILRSEVMRKVELVVAILLIPSMLCSCGSDYHSDFEAPQGVLRISPAAATLHTGASAQFKAIRNSEWVREVRWSLSGNNCTGAGCGTIDPNGFYTAPSVSPGRIILCATLTADASTRATAEINVTANFATLNVLPSTASVVAGETQTFDVTNCVVIFDVAWGFELSGLGCSGNSCGSLSRTLGTSTIYTAPSEVPDPATVYLRISDLFTSKTAVITVVVNGSELLPEANNLATERLDSFAQRSDPPVHSPRKRQFQIASAKFRAPSFTVKGSVERFLRGEADAIVKKF
jgi:hypothetical protein